MVGLLIAFASRGLVKFFGEKKYGWDAHKVVPAFILTLEGLATPTLRILYLAYASSPEAAGRVAAELGDQPGQRCTRQRHHGAPLPRAT